MNTAANLKSLCVFCASNVGRDPVFLETARAVGETLARRGIGVVYGGASVGLMGALADAALAKGGRVVGVLPEALFGKEVAHPGLSELHRVHSMHERKTVMYELSEAFIALPGGLGTLEEIFEIVTWAQLGLHKKPCGFLNVGGYYDDILRLLDRMVMEGFLKEKHRRFIAVEASLDGLLDRFRVLTPPSDGVALRPDEV